METLYHNNNNKNLNILFRINSNNLFRWFNINNSHSSWIIIKKFKCKASEICNRNLKIAISDDIIFYLTKTCNINMDLQLDRTSLSTIFTNGRCSMISITKCWLQLGLPKSRTMHASNTNNTRRKMLITLSTSEKHLNWYLFFM